MSAPSLKMATTTPYSLGYRVRKGVRQGVNYLVMVLLAALVLVLNDVS